MTRARLAGMILLKTSSNWPQLLANHSWVRSGETAVCPTSSTRTDQSVVDPAILAGSPAGHQS